MCINHRKRGLRWSYIVLKVILRKAGMGLSRGRSTVQVSELVTTVWGTVGSQFSQISGRGKVNHSLQVSVFSHYLHREGEWPSLECISLHVRWGSQCLVSTHKVEFGGWGRERRQTFSAVEVSALSCSAESRIPALVKNYQVKIVWKVCHGNINKLQNQQWFSVKKWATKTTCEQPWIATPEPQSAFITALSHHFHRVHLSWLGEVLSILIPHQHQHLEDWYPGAEKILHINFSCHTHVDGCESGEKIAF